ncbi:MAG: DUF3794 domain-containing protein, partial [Clostridia bacterium]|nr:DUF3794 domain-containing protein [Clostridia bacterium]
ISAICSVNCERISVKLLSPRRMIIKSSLGAFFEIEGEASVKALAVNEDSETFFRKKTIGFEGRTLLQTGEYRFGEALALNQSEKSIGEIVCGSVCLQEPQLSLSPGRAEIRTTALIKVLCEEEDGEGRYYMAIKTLPVAIDYANDAVEEHKHVSVELEPFDSEFIPELDQYGENRVIKTAFSVKMKLKMNEPKAYTVADDMFEKNHLGQLIKTTAPMPRLFEKTDRSFSAEAKLAPTEPAAELILDSSAKNASLTVEKAEGGINIKGSFIVTLVYNTAEGIYSTDHSLPYEQFLAIELPEGESNVVADTYPIEVITTLHSDGSVTARVIAGTRVCVYTEAEETFISEVSKRTELSHDGEPDALVFCFPEKNESLWSIAKLYRADPAAIAEHNPAAFDENGNVREQGKPILIKA